MTTGRPVSLARLGEDLERRDAEPLEGERRGARLEGAAAQHRGAAAAATASATSSVCSRDSTVHGPGDQAERLAAADAAPGDLEVARLVMAELAARELVGTRDRDDAVDARHALDPELGDALGVADRADRRRQLARHHDDVDAGRLEALDDGVDLRLAAPEVSSRSSSARNLRSRRASAPVAARDGVAGAHPCPLAPATSRPSPHCGGRLTCPSAASVPPG